MTPWIEFFPNGDATEFSAFIFDTFDLNVNGSIEFDEFIQVFIHNYNYDVFKVNPFFVVFKGFCLCIKLQAENWFVKRKK